MAVTSANGRWIFLASTGVLMGTEFHRRREVRSRIKFGNK